MQQTIVSVVFPLAPANAVLLQDRLEALRTRLGGTADNFAGLRDGLPTLHFLSMVVFDEMAGVPDGGMPVTPLFVLEANVDGAPGPFWAALEALIGEDLREILRLCAPPRGAGDALFWAVTAPGARLPVAPLLERQSVFPAAGHAGNRGLSRTRILCHDTLFRAAQALLPPPADVLAGGAVGLHAWLRAALLPQFTWLSQTWTPPITHNDMQADRRALWVFGLCVALAAASPWLVVGSLVGPAPACVAALLAGVASLLFLPDLGDLLHLLGRPAYRALPFAIGLGLLAALVLPFFVVRHGVIAWLALAVAGLLASVFLLLAALRRAERADPAPAELRATPRSRLGAAELGRLPLRRAGPYGKRGHHQAGLAAIVAVTRGHARADTGGARGLHRRLSGQHAHYSFCALGDCGWRAAAAVPEQLRWQLGKLSG